MNGRKILSWLRAVGRAPGAVFAVVVLLWLFVEIWCVSDKTTSTDENRTLEPFPLVARVLEGDYDFGRRFERWFADHFRHRKSMVRLSGRIRLRGNSRVLHGKDGWLYLNVQGAPQCFSHVNRLDEGQLAVARRRTAEFGRRAKAAGIGHVYFVFSNDKESICPEFYPDGHAKVHPESRFDQLWVNGCRATRARSPNRGYFYMEQPHEDGRQAFWANPRDVAPFATLGSDAVTNTVMHFYLMWQSGYGHLKSVDATTGLVLTHPATGWYDYFHCKDYAPRYVLENFRAALDEAGEWFLDVTVKYLRVIQDIHQHLDALGKIEAVGDALVDGE